MKKILNLLVFGLCLINVSCTTTTSSVTPVGKTGMTELNRWISSDLVPYLHEKMGLMPKYKGQSFIIVRTKDDEIMPEIDDLTDEIRSRVKSELKAYSGFNLVWRPAVSPWTHHTEISRVKCNRADSVQYFVGIDVQVMKVSGRLKVRVQCIDREGEAWENDFFREWESAPTRVQLAALQTVHKDEHLRGLRPLPFNEEAPDLLASYIAHNLSCLLKRVPAEDIRLNAVRKGMNDNRFFTKALDLVDNYLDKFQSVTILRGEHKNANFRLTTEVHHIFGDLYQIWAGLAEQNTGQTQGLHTDAYVIIKPLKTEISWAGANGGEIQSNWTSPAGSFQVVVPERSDPSTPYSILPEKTLDSDSVISESDPLAFRFSPAKSAFCYLISQDPEGEVKVLYPNRCGGARQDNYHEGGKILRFPQNASLAPTGGWGMEMVYFVAISDPLISEEFRIFLSGTQGLCDGNGSKSGRSLAKESLKAYLKGMQQEHMGVFGWNQRSFRVAGSSSY